MMVKSVSPINAIGMNGSERNEANNNKNRFTMKQNGSGVKLIFEEKWQSRT